MNWTPQTWPAEAERRRQMARFVMNDIQSRGGKPTPITLAMLGLSDYLDVASFQIELAEIEMEVFEELI